jgi:hypothetical protein
MEEKKNGPGVRDCGLTPRQTCRLAVGRKITYTSFHATEFPSHSVILVLNVSLLIRTKSHYLWHIPDAPLPARRTSTAWEPSTCNPWHLCPSQFGGPMSSMLSGLCGPVLCSAVPTHDPANPIDKGSGWHCRCESLSHIWTVICVI